MGIRTKLGIAFLSGLFLMGIGGGVAFAEFSSFQMEEETVIGADNATANTIAGQIPSEEGRIYVYLNNECHDIQIKADASMGADEVEFISEYDDKAVVNYLNIREDKNAFYIYYYFRDYYMFNYMDDILNSIKDRKIPNYRRVYVKNLVIKVAPENESRIKVVY